MVKKEPLMRSLYDILCCPVCKEDLKYNKKKDGLSCASCHVVYPIKEGIPVLLPQK